MLYCVNFKTVLKMCSWTGTLMKVWIYLQLKEDELRNIRADCAANYNKRVEEITLRLNEKDVKLTASMEENQTLKENMKDLPLKVCLSFFYMFICCFG